MTKWQITFDLVHPLCVWRGVVNFCPESEVLSRVDALNMLPTITVTDVRMVD